MFYQITKTPFKNPLKPSEIARTAIILRKDEPYDVISRTYDGDFMHLTDDQAKEKVLETFYEENYPNRQEKETISELKLEVSKQNKSILHAEQFSQKAQADSQKAVEITEQLNRNFRLLTDVLIHAEDLTEAQKSLILAQYDEWQARTWYEQGTVIKYQDKLFEVVQSHTPQSDWIPPQTPALYTMVKNTEFETEDGGEIEIIKDFIKPTGAHDAYQAGDKVRYEGNIYESVMDTNAYSPSEYPSGWELVELDIEEEVEAKPTEPEEEVTPEDEPGEKDPKETEEVPEFKQPTGGHDAYQTGDRVSFDGKIYESTMDGSVWSPIDYPQGWTEVEQN